METPHFLQRCLGPFLSQILIFLLLIVFYWNCFPFFIGEKIVPAARKRQLSSYSLSIFFLWFLLKKIIPAARNRRLASAPTSCATHSCAARKKNAHLYAHIHCLYKGATHSSERGRKKGGGRGGKAQEHLCLCAFVSLYTWKYPRKKNGHAHLYVHAFASLYTWTYACTCKRTCMMSQCQ